MPLADEGMELARAKLSLGARHPLAPWLSSKGAHTGGKWYTLDLDSLVFLDFYGGPAKLTVKEYLSAEALENTDTGSATDNNDDDDDEQIKTVLA
jgi:hypothetical protein